MNDAFVIQHAVKYITMDTSELCGACKSQPGQTKNRPRVAKKAFPGVSRTFINLTLLQSSKPAHTTVSSGSCNFFAILFPRNSSMSKNVFRACIGIRYMMQKIATQSLHESEPRPLVLLIHTRPPTSTAQTANVDHSVN